MFSDRKTSTKRTSSIYLIVNSALNIHRRVIEVIRHSNIQTTFLSVTKIKRIYAMQFSQFDSV